MIRDISLPISDSMIVWPGDPKVKTSRVLDLKRGDPVTLTKMSMGTHTATHVDAPSHCYRGRMSVDEVPLSLLIGRAWVADTGNAAVLDAGILATLGIPRRLTRILFKTRNSREWKKSGRMKFRKDFVALTVDGAQWLVKRGVRLVGVDYLSVGPFTAPLPTHHVILKAGGIIVEGLNLSGVKQGYYSLVCLPMKLAGADGAPARVVLVDE